MIVGGAATASSLFVRDFCGLLAIANNNRQIAKSEFGDERVLLRVRVPQKLDLQNAYKL